MKRNTVAILLSISLIVGPFSTASLYAAEVTAQEAITEIEQGGENVPFEDDSLALDEEEAAGASSQSAAEESLENESAGGEDQDISDEIEVSDNGSSDESGEKEIAEEGISDEDATEEEAGSEATNLDTEMAAVVEQTVESTEGKEAARAVESGDVVASGSCGEHATWTLTGTEEGLTLTISGSGDMADYYVTSCTDDNPWADYRARISEIVIQDGINSIGEYAFYDFSNLKSVAIPNSVSEIGSYSFAHCSNLYVIELPENSITIGSGAFSGCTSLSSISLPDTLQYLGSYAFQNCYSLNSISVPDNVTDLGDYAFNGCSLDVLRIPVSIVSNSRSTAFLQGVYTVKLIIYGEGEIANTTYGCMGSGSLRGSVVDLVFEGDITYIGSSVFFQNNSSYPQFTSLQTITLPATVIGFSGSERNKIANESITVIGYGNTYSEIWALRNQYTFEAIDTIELSGTLNNGISWVLSSDRTLTISGNGVVDQNPCPWQQYVRVIKKVVIEEGITEIGDCSFCDGGQLIEEVTLPESLTKIGSFAFANCAIESITIPSGVTEIKNQAFYNSLLTSIDIPENVSIIGAYAFQNCKYLEEMRVPNSALSNSKSMICPGGYTSGCSSLNTIYIYGEGSIPSFSTYSTYNESPFYSSRNTIETIIIEEGITGVSTNAFSGCVNVSYVRLPSTMHDKDLYSRRASFAGCPNLKTAGPLGSGCNIEYGWMDRIPNYAFEDMRYLESIVFPESLKEIGVGAFWRCDNLQEAIIPDTVEKIEQSAFRGCGLTHVYIPSGVKTMGTYIFADCSNLTSVGPADSGCDIEYGWTGKIPDNAFSNCNFDTVRLSDTIKIIGTYAFESTIIDSFIMPSRVITINEYAFFGSKINKMVFKGNIPSINASAFYAATCTAYYPYGNETYTSSTMVGYGGTIAWKADPETTGTLTELELINEPSKKLYVTGEELSLEGLQIKAYYDSGYDEIIDGVEITIGEYDLSTPGKKNY